MEGQVKLHLEVEQVDELDLTIYRSNGLAFNEEAMPDEKFNPEIVTMVNLIFNIYYVSFR